MTGSMPATSSPTRVRPLRLLVVLPDPRVRQAVRRLLMSTADLQVVAEATDATRARQAVATTHPDAVLVDVGPGHCPEGLDLVRDLAVTLPVIATSPGRAEQRAALAAGAVLHLEQDGDPEQILAALRGLRPRPEGQVAREVGASPVAALSPLRMAAVLAAVFLPPWAVWGSRIAQEDGLLGWHLPQGVALWSMTLPLALALLLTGGRAALRDLGSHLARFRVSPRWYAVALGAPMAVAAAAAGLTLLLRGQVEPGRLMSLPAALTYLTYGVGLYLLTEEAAWRGVLLPWLQHRHSPLVASVVLGLVWALWHVPLLNVPGERDQGLPLGGFALLIVGTSVLVSALVNRAGGSVVIAALFHASFNASYSWTGVVGGDRRLFWSAVAVTVVAAVAVAARTRGRLGLPA
ncbi:MAG: CPBP family glutamic-type intramembrane protease [Oryzihumus sp.]